MGTAAATRCRSSTSADATSGASVSAPRATGRNALAFDRLDAGRRWVPHVLRRWQGYPHLASEPSQIGRFDHRRAAAAADRHHNGVTTTVIYHLLCSPARKVAGDGHDDGELA